MSDRSRFQLDWDVARLHSRWPTGPDNDFLLARIRDVTLTAVRSGLVRGRILEVGASDAGLSRPLAGDGFEVVAVDPSARMLSQARRKATARDTPLSCVRGLGEELPFLAGSFDVVLCDSALDHMAAPDEALHEMARVTKSTGRLVIGFVNYGGLTVRLSRLAYRILRRLRILAADEHLFWDSPVPYGEHTFECTYPLIRGLCRDTLRLETVRGISIGCAFPGWGRLLGRLPRRVARGAVRTFDVLARSAPFLADYVVTVWRPNPTSQTRDTDVPSSAEPLRVRPSNPVHARLVAEERQYWSGPNADESLRARLPRSVLDAERRVLDDLFARGPFPHAAMLGSHGGRLENMWLDHEAGMLDVFDLTPSVLHEAARGLSRSARARCRFHECDLNFIRLPAARYDAIWSFDTLHYVVNLENLFAEVDRALRPDGLFAFRAYVGDPRFRHSPARVERVRECLKLMAIHGNRVPGDVPPPNEFLLSPFCAVRPDAILPLARERFDVVREDLTGGLFPVPFWCDLDALAHEQPALHAEVVDCERAALEDPAVGPSIAYMVLRRRRSSHSM